MKSFYVPNNIGKAKHVVCYHDGHKKYGDGSPLFDIRIFKNKQELNRFLSELKSNGYVEK